MSVSVRTSPGVAYPDADASYSPSERYPEYRFGSVASRPNPVYAMVRELWAQLGLDAARFGTPEWNPLGAYVPRGSRVFVLCNFVYHRRAQDSVADLVAKCTHGSVLRAVVDYLILAAGPDATIRFGNAPLQSCEWGRVLEDTGAAKVAEFYEREGIDVRAQDLRLFVTRRTVLGRVLSHERREAPGDAVEIDLGAESLLDGIAKGPRQRARFRVADYDPARIESFHADGSHRYVIHRAILDSDVVFSVPKLKTHEKVGITCGLKGFVGTVGHKDCLAHHRYGNPRVGGDEYPDANAFARPASALHDWIHRRAPGSLLQGPLQIIDRNVRRVLRRAGVVGGGAWHGNDTAWRMTLDLARIVHYADAAGRLHDNERRRHLLLIDGIVAGEGEGPLAPTPLSAGTLLFADDVVVGDRVACRLMGFDPQAIALVREAPRVLGRDPDSRSEVLVDGRSLIETELQPVVARAFRPPSGWRASLARAG